MRGVLFVTIVPNEVVGGVSKEPFSETAYKVVVRETTAAV